MKMKDALKRKLDEGSALRASAIGALAALLASTAGAAALRALADYVTGGMA